jgi:hypothetical protein
MEIEGCSATSADINQTKLRHISEDSNLYRYSQVSRSLCVPLLYSRHWQTQSLNANCTLNHATRQYTRFSLLSRSD